MFPGNQALERDDRAFARLMEQKAMQNLVADPTQLTTLRSVLDEYCAQHSVVDLNDRDEYARRILALFSSGVTCRTTLLHKMNGLALGRHQEVAL